MALPSLLSSSTETSASGLFRDSERAGNIAVPSQQRFSREYPASRTSQITGSPSELSGVSTPGHDLAMTQGPLQSLQGSFDCSAFRFARPTRRFALGPRTHREFAGSS